MAYFGIDNQIRNEELLTKLKFQIRKANNTESINHLMTSFKKFDQNCNGSLSLREFEAALASYGLFMKKVELKALFDEFDINKNGAVSYQEFVRALREPKLVGRKLNIVKTAWGLLGGDEAASGSAISSAYKSVDLDSFLKGFENTKNGDLSGLVTYTEFEDFYKAVAMIIPNDDYFVAKVEEQWGLNEDAYLKVNKDTVMRIINLLRQRIRCLSNNNRDDFTLKNIFRNFDSNETGSIGLLELHAIFSKFEVAITQAELVAIFKFLDINENGVISFDEFSKFLNDDPYTKF